MEETLKQILSHFNTKGEKELIEKAYEVAAQGHKEQKRASGEPYIVHPLDTALTLAQMDMDAATVAAGLLHDVVDDTPVTLKEIEKEFGKEIAFLVDGVSKLGKLKYRGAQRHAENLRKMLVAMAEDVRVILIKFADRMHNIKTLDALPERKQHRIATETLEIYAPTAVRLGVSELGKQLEDLAFPYVYPEEYRHIKEEANYRFRDAEKYLKRLRPTLLKNLAKENIKPKEVEMRAKHYYSLWRKLERQKYNWSQVHDLIAVRIIVDSIDDCYKTLGAIHKMWKPLPGRIKDYIALPKPNGYQSLHTTVFCVGGRQTEFQIRTPEMHEHAEYGIAAHWKYKNRGKHSSKQSDKTYGWVKQLQEWKKDASPTDEFLSNLKVDVFGDRIFVFTPEGDVIDLPKGATPVDFAYHIHSAVGDRCAGAKCNGKMVALNHELQNGDVVEVITSKNKTPSEAWLQFVKTRAARGNIRRWFREHNRDKNKETGLRMLNEELKALEGKTWSRLSSKKRGVILERFSQKTDEDLFVAIGQGDISVNRITHALVESSYEEPKKGKRTPVQTPVPTPKKGAHVVVAGAAGLKTRIAQCCNPKKPQEIAAYITINQGASVHSVNCPNLYALTGKNDKVLPAYWTDESESRQTVKLEISTTDRVGMLEGISHCIAEQNINILSLRAGKEVKTKKPPKNGDAFVIAGVEVAHTRQLKSLLEKLKRIEGVESVRRIR